jgi:hypothetical protein
MNIQLAEEANTDLVAATGMTRRRLETIPWWNTHLKRVSTIRKAKTTTGTNVGYLQSELDDHASLGVAPRRV